MDRRAVHLTLSVCLLLLSFFRIASGAQCAAVKTCIAELDAGRPCPTFPVPPSRLGTIIAPGVFNLTELRDGVYSYEEGIYLVVIIVKGKRLVVIDFPDTVTLLPDGVKKVLRGRFRIGSIWFIAIGILTILEELTNLPSGQLRPIRKHVFSCGVRREPVSSSRSDVQRCHFLPCSFPQWVAL